MSIENPPVAACGCQPEGQDLDCRFCVNTEGHEHPWNHDSITVEEIARLGGWDVAQGVIEVLADNTERQLKPGEVVHLRPGREFCRRVRWKRGFQRGDRLAEELALLRQVYPNAEHRDGWFRIPDFRLPSGWSRTQTELAFQLPPGYPATPPYGIYVPIGLTFSGSPPANYTEQLSNKPPFPGTWGILSWQVFEPADWYPRASAEHGANLRQWAQGCSARFGEGT